MAKILHRQGKTWWVETPMPRKDHPSVFKLPDFIEFFKQTGIEMQIVAQCNYGSSFKKLTAFASNIKLNLKPECWHAWREWIIPWSGQAHTLPHPPLMGEQMAILKDKWNPQMKRRCEPAGPWLTKHAAIYPQQAE